MAGAKGKKLAARAMSGTARKHHCPNCPATEDGKLEPMTPVMVMPKRKMKYVCKNGHETNRGGTILA